MSVATTLSPIEILNPESVGLGKCETWFTRAILLIGAKVLINPTRERQVLAIKLLSRFSIGNNGCIEWSGAKDSNGYGNLYVGGGHSAPRYSRAHRIAVELFVGPVSDGLHIDHLCRNPACFNLQHLEVVTAKENSLRGMSPNAKNARKTHCKRGHEFTPENTYYTRFGFRNCRACQPIHEMRRREKRRANHAS